jgi:phospho-N-acetylmuramoyl-pentapeptide-transferase
MHIFDISKLTDELLTILLFGFLGFVFAMIITPIYTNLAYKYKWWKKPRTQALTGEKAEVFHKLHAEKHRRNIPTMAGMIVLASVLLVTILLNWSREQTYLPIAATLGAGMVGLLDDVINLKGLASGVAGLSAKIKFWLIFFVATIGAWFFYFKLDYTTIHVPFVGSSGEVGVDFTIGLAIIPLFIFVILATANSVNMTDGLDGLAGGLLVSAFASYATIAFLQGNYGIAGFCLTIVGALLAYVWFNIYPARFFMGDIGSFALGTALGVVAMLTDTLVLLPIIGFVFVIEAGSVILQLLSKKFRGKKIFKSTPIHHHFEAKGWPETKVTMRFWVIGQVFGAAGILIAIVGGYI